MLPEELEQLKQSIIEAEYVDIEAPFEENYNPWVLEPFIPLEAISILDGLGGSGKSWFALDIAYSISLGQAFLGKFPVRQSGPVLYLTAEEVPQMFLQRLRMIRKYYPRSENFFWISMLNIFIEISPALCRKRRGEQTVTEMAEILERRISERKPVLVILDSLINFYGLDENSSEDAMFFYDVLKHYMRRYSTSFLLLHHQNKEGMRAQADDVISFRGSGVLREQARSRIIYKNVKLEEGVIARKIMLEKSNYYSKLKGDTLPEEGLYLKFDNGVHVYDRNFADYAKRKEEEMKQKGRKKESNKNNGKQTYPRADL